MSNSKVFNETEINSDDHSLDENISKSTVLKDFLALIKIGIVNSNLITVFAGIWLALQFNDLRFLSNISTVLLAVVGSALVMAGSCSLNNFIDRDIDNKMERTKARPTVSGSFHPSVALIVGFLFITVGTAMLFQTTITAGIIGLIGVFSYVVLYSLWSKRHYPINTIIGSISGAVPPLIGWAAIDANLHTAAWVLFLIMFIWQPPHFWALAMKRTEEYRAAGIPMLPVVYGFNVTKRQMVVWVALLLPLPFYLIELGIPFVILATLLNIGWLIIGLYGFKMKDDLKWANWMFIYSLNYLTIMFVSMVIVTLI